MTPLGSKLMNTGTAPRPSDAEISRAQFRALFLQYEPEMLKVLDDFKELGMRNLVIYCKT